MPVPSALLHYFYLYAMIGEMPHLMGPVNVGKGPGVSDPSITQVV